MNCSTHSLRCVSDFKTFKDALTYLLKSSLPLSNHSGAEVFAPNLPYNKRLFYGF
jgi:hypothetical protein